MGGGFPNICNLLSFKSNGQRWHVGRAAKGHLFTTLRRRAIFPFEVVQTKLREKTDFLLTNEQ